MRSTFKPKPYITYAEDKLRTYKRTLKAIIHSFLLPSKIKLLKTEGGNEWRENFSMPTKSERLSKDYKSKSTTDKFEGCRTHIRYWKYNRTLKAIILFYFFICFVFLTSVAKIFKAEGGKIFKKPFQWKPEMVQIKLSKQDRKGTSSHQQLMTLNYTNLEINKFSPQGTALFRFSTIVGSNLN